LFLEIGIGRKALLKALATSRQQRQGNDE